MAELTFTVKGPEESEYVVTLPNGDTQRVLEMGEFLIFRAPEGHVQSDYVDSLQQLHQVTGRYIVVLYPGQELERILLTQTK